MQYKLDDTHARDLLTFDNATDRFEGDKPVDVYPPNMFAAFSQSDESAFDRVSSPRHRSLPTCPVDAKGVHYRLSRPADPVTKALRKEVTKLLKSARSEASLLINTNAKAFIGEQLTIFVSTRHRLGMGAFAEVYEGTYGKERVAVKLLFPKFEKSSETSLASTSGSPKSTFMREIQFLSVLNSPHIVKFYGYGSCFQGRLTILTELLSNGSVAKYLYEVNAEQKPHFNPEQQYRIILDVAKAVAYLHQKEICHGDIKNDNILLDYHFRAKLADFGLAEFFSEMNTNASKKFHGSLLYSPPECFLGERKTPAADVYSYGLAVWEVLMHQEVFPDITNAKELMLRVVVGARPKTPDKLPACQVDFMKKCWDASPRDRCRGTLLPEHVSRIKSSFFQPANAPEITSGADEVISGEYMRKRRIPWTLVEASQNVDANKRPAITMSK